MAGAKSKTMQKITSNLTVELADGDILPGGDTLDSPLDHLAYALGSCLLHFADRFLQRRGLARQATLNLEWTLDQKTCRVEQMAIGLNLEAEIATGEQEVLESLLATCPVHQALESGMPLAFSLHAGQVKPRDPLTPPSVEMARTSWPQR